MSQTSIISAALVIGFIIFVTTRGELPGYLGVLLGSTKSAPTTAGGAVAQNGIQSLAQNFLQGFMF